MNKGKLNKRENSKEKKDQKSVNFKCRYGVM